MKTKSVLFIMAALLCAQAHAGADKGGNGGDMCEDRFKIIRDDISLWLTKGGSSGLSLPEAVSLAQYNSAMKSQIASARLSCTSDTVLVDNVEKTCKNFVTPEGQSQIICNSRRFLGTSESDQYVLVHHEYAGLAGLEVNDEEGSHYSISNQITAFLENVVIKKLAVRPNTLSRSAAYPFQASCTLVGYQTESGQAIPLPKSLSFVWSIKSHEESGRYVTDDVRVQSGSSDFPLREDFLSARQVFRELELSKYQTVSSSPPNSGWYRISGGRYYQYHEIDYDKYFIDLDIGQVRELLNDLGAGISRWNQSQLKVANATSFRLTFTFLTGSGIEGTAKEANMIVLYQSGTPAFARFKLQMTCTPISNR